MDKENIENIPSISITVKVSHHEMTEEEIKQEKKEERERRKRLRQEYKEKKKERKALKNSFKTLDKCMIRPKNIKLGNLERCLEYKMITHFEFMGAAFGHIVDKYEPFEGEKVLIQVGDKIDSYFELDKINTRKDLKKIRNSIEVDGIDLNDTILSTKASHRGEIIVVRESIHEHPLFENMEEEISLRKVKEIISNVNFKR